MIDDELLAKFDRIQDLSVSEEMLGAYAEGNVTDSEQLLISSIADSSSEISSLLCEVEDLDIEKLEGGNYDFNQFDSILGAVQELPDIDEYTLSENYVAISADIESIDTELLDPFDNKSLECHIVSDNSPDENKNFYMTGDSSEQENYSLDTTSDADGDTDFESEGSDFNNLDF